MDVLQVVARTKEEINLRRDFPVVHPVSNVGGLEKLFHTLWKNRETVEDIKPLLYFRFSFAFFSPRTEQRANTGYNVTQALLYSTSPPAFSLFSPAFAIFFLHFLSVWFWGSVREVINRQ